MASTPALKVVDERASAADRIGNPIDPLFRCAHGQIERSTDEEVVRMLRARRIVGDLVRSRGVGAEGPDQDDRLALAYALGLEAQAGQY